jgi:antagonist of KipI
MNKLRVLDAVFATLQDAGRPGWERFGLPAGGAMDWIALRAANLLVSNPPKSCAIELALGALVLEAQVDTLLTLTGAGFRLEVNGIRMPNWSAVRVRGGQTVQVIPQAGSQAGRWGYLGAAGGIDVPPVLGSRSTYLRAGLGGLEGRVLRPGDELPLGRTAVDWQIAGSRIPPEARPPYARQVTARVVLGPQADWFSPAAFEQFLSSEYRLSPLSDRMGSRLEGPPLERARQGDLLSEGMVTGAVQVPPDGRPIVMMPDRPATGGYPKIACVIQADLPLVAQLPPGEGALRFQAVTVAEAREALRGMDWTVEEVE